MALKATASSGSSITNIYPNRPPVDVRRRCVQDFASAGALLAAPPDRIKHSIQGASRGESRQLGPKYALTRHRGLRPVESCEPTTPGSVRDRAIYFRSHHRHDFATFKMR